MENRKENAALNEKLLDKISGGVDRDYTQCAWNLNGDEHEWVMGENGKRICLYCGVYID